MKKIISLVIVCILAAAMCLPTFATDAAPAQDITADVKFATAMEIYTGFLPVVRTDAQFISWDTYTNGGDAGFKAPGIGQRDIFMMGFPFVNFFNDRFVIDVSKKEEYVMLQYPTCWQNNYEDGSPAKFVYNVDIPKDGIYEFVVVGCAQITEDNVDNDAKDRGFSISVDGQDKKQVNISDTQLAFRKYEYNYSLEDVKSKNITTTNGVNSQYFQVGYVYNITYELTKGTHTIEYYHLESSGDTRVDGGNSSRLNFMGLYVQEFLTETELANYKYPETSEIIETDAPTQPVTTKAETTKAETKPADPKTDAATKAPETPTMTAKAPETTAATEKKGCGSVVGCGAVVVVAILGSALVAKKRK